MRRRGHSGGTGGRAVGAGVRIINEARRGELRILRCWRGKRQASARVVPCRACLVGVRVRVRVLGFARWWAWTRSMDAWMDLSWALGRGGWSRGGGMRRAWAGSAWTGSTAMVMGA